MCSKEFSLLVNIFKDSFTDFRPSCLESLYDVLNAPSIFIIISNLYLMDQIL